MLASDSASNGRTESEQPPFQHAIDRSEHLEDAFGREGENNRKVNYASAYGAPC